MADRLRNRTTAILITVVLVLLSILLGAYLSLTNLRNDVHEIYMSGDEQGGWDGIYDSLSTIRWHSDDLLTLANTYLSADDDVILAVSQSAETLEHVSESPEKAYAAEQELLDAIEALDARLQEESLSSTDETTRSELISDIAASEHRVEQAEIAYNQAAEEFNNTLTRFPAGILGDIVGVQTVELYA